MVVAYETRHEDRVAALLAEAEVAHVRGLGGIADAFGGHGLPGDARPVGLASGLGHRDAEAERGEQGVPEGAVSVECHGVHEADAHLAARAVGVEVGKGGDEPLLEGHDVRGL